MIALLIWAVKDISFQETWELIKNLTFTQVAFLVLLNSLIVLLISSRWWIILRAGGKAIPFMSLVGYRQAAFAISYFTPGTQFGGEPAQINLVQSRHAIPIQSAVASVSMDKLLDLLANFTFLAVGVLMIIWQGVLVELPRLPLIFSTAVLVLIPFSYLIMLTLGWQPLSRLGAKIPQSWLARISLTNAVPLVESIERELIGLSRERPWLLLILVCLSAFTWLSMILEYWLMVLFLGIRLNLTQTITALTAARAAFLVPLPGSLGALEGSQVFALSAMGFDPSLGLSIGLLIRARDVLFGLAGLGLLAFYYRKRDNSSFS
jgi:uncharacterized protein (TIRG00374 family)